MNGDSSVDAGLSIKGLWVRTHPRAKLNFCRALALWVYSVHSVKWVPAFGGRVPPHRAGNKNTGLCPSLIGYHQWLHRRSGWKRYPLLEINSTHTGIEYAYLIAPHSCDYMGYVRHIRHPTRSSKNTCDYLVYNTPVLGDDQSWLKNEVIFVKY